MSFLLGESGNKIIANCSKDYINLPAAKCNNQVLLRDNYLSEFVTKEEKEKVLKNLGIYDNAFVWGQIGGFLDQQTDLWNYLQNIVNQVANKIDKELPGNNATTQIAYTNSAYPNVTTLKDALDQILYKALTVTLSCSPTIKEVGEIVDSIVFTWSYNKPNIEFQSFDGMLLNTNDRSITINGPFTTDVTKTLNAGDGSSTISTSASLRFYLGIYYGTSTENLQRLLQANRQATITVDGTNNKETYIYIYIPYSYGQPTFTVNGFTGGFELIDDNYQLDKYETGNPIRYYVYRSDNGGLGVTTINIS